MSAVDMTVRIVVECKECGSGDLDIEIIRPFGRQYHLLITVVPCAYCLSDARKNAYENGYDRGVSDGPKQGENVVGDNEVAS